MRNAREQAIEQVRAAIVTVGKIDPPDLLRDAEHIPQAERLLHQAVVHLLAIPSEVDQHGR